jgi:integrase
MHLIPPHGRNKKWTVRLRNHDGRFVKVPGDEDRDTAWRIGERVRMLVKAKENGDPPPGELKQWIDNMPKLLSDRLVSLGLLTQRRLERSKPLSEHVEIYGRIVRTRKSNKLRHAQQQESKVRRICNAISAERFDDLTERKLLDHLEGLELAVSTRRGFIIAMKDFANEMVRLGVSQTNPFQHIVPPGQYEDPEYERHPLTVAEFKKLMRYLETFERYPRQKSRWTAADRRILYWTAVKSGYRENELRKLKVFNLYLDEKPSVIGLKARHNKNKEKGEVPIPNDLARALKKYVAGRDPTDPIFIMPETSGSIVDMFRRDLDGAGIPWQLPGGEIVDFHTLRSTCITWWLTVDGLKAKRVQVLARLKSLSLVDRYSRNYKIEEFGWLNKSPKLVGTRRRRAG